MDAKVTLSFDEKIIAQAKEYAKSKNMSLSRLTEYIFKKITSSNQKGLYDLPIHDWVLELAAGEPQYNRKSQSKKDIRNSYYTKHDSHSLAAEDKASYNTKKNK